LRELSKMSGVAADTINQIELGHRKARPSTLRKVARALDVSVEDFYMEPSLPNAEAPPVEDIPNSVAELLERRGARTRHLTDERLKDRFDELSYEDAFQVAQELRTEVETISPDLRRFVERLSHNTKAMSLFSEVAKQFWIARLSLAVNEQAMQELDEAEVTLVGSS
jgi:transcriptional regulator with XRE-family HTH domain